MAVGHPVNGDPTHGHLGDAYRGYLGDVSWGSPGTGSVTTAVKHMLYIINTNLSICSFILIGFWLFRQTVKSFCFLLIWFWASILQCQEYISSFKTFKNCRNQAWGLSSVFSHNYLISFICTILLSLLLDPKSLSALANVNNMRLVALTVL